MTIDIINSNNTGTISTIVVRGTGLSNLVYYLSSSKRLSGSDFGEYEFKHKVTKKYNSDNLLNYLKDLDLDLLLINEEEGYDIELLDIMQDFVIPSYGSGDSDSQIRYFGSIMVNDRTIYFIDIPSGYSSLYIFSGYYKKSLGKSGSSSRLRSDCDIYGSLTSGETSSRNAIIFSSSPSKDTSSINFSYKCWCISEDPARFKNRYNLRNDEYLSLGSSLTSSVLEVGESSYLQAKLTGDLLGCINSESSQYILLVRALEEIRKNKRGDIGQWKSTITYNKGDHCVYGDAYGIVTSLYTSKVDGNRNNTPPTTYSSNDYWYYEEGSFDIYTWSPDVSYRRGDLCVLGRDVWYSLSDLNYNNYPACSSSWINNNVISNKNYYDYTVSILSRPGNSISFYGDDPISEFVINREMNTTVSFLIKANPGYKLNLGNLIDGWDDYTVTEVTLGEKYYYVILNITPDSVIRFINSGLNYIMIRTIAVPYVTLIPEIEMGEDQIFYGSNISEDQKSCQIASLLPPFTFDNLELQFPSDSSHRFSYNSEDHACWESDINSIDKLLIVSGLKDNISVSSITAIGEGGESITVEAGVIEEGPGSTKKHQIIELPVNVQGNSRYILNIEARDLTLSSYASNNLGVTLSEHFSTVPFGPIDSMTGPEKIVKFKLEPGYEFQDNAVIIKCFFSGLADDESTELGHATVIFTKNEIENPSDVVSKSVSIDFGAGYTIESDISISKLENDVYKIVFSSFHFDSTIYINI